MGLRSALLSTLQPLCPVTHSLSLSHALSLEILSFLINAKIKVSHPILSLLWYSITPIMSGPLNQSILDISVHLGTTHPPGSRLGAGAS